MGPPLLCDVQTEAVDFDGAMGGHGTSFRVRTGGYGGERFGAGAGGDDGTWPGRIRQQVRGVKGASAGAGSGGRDHGALRGVRRGA